MFSWIIILQYNFRNFYKWFLLAVIPLAILLVVLYNIKNSLWLIEERDINLLMGAIIPFFSAFIVISMWEELVISEFSEIIYPFRKKIYICYVIYNTLFYLFLINILYMYTKIFYNTYICVQVFLMCIYIQVLISIFLLYFKSTTVAIGLLFLYFTISIILSMDPFSPFISGYFSTIELDIFSFIKYQGWKILSAVACFVIILNKKLLK